MFTEAHGSVSSMQFSLSVPLLVIRLLRTAATVLVGRRRLPLDTSGFFLEQRSKRLLSLQPCLSLADSLSEVYLLSSQQPLF
jgi:hypothetical protein